MPDVPKLGYDGLSRMMGQTVIGSGLPLRRTYIQEFYKKINVKGDLLWCRHVMERMKTKLVDKKIAVSNQAATAYEYKKNYVIHDMGVC